MNHIENGTGGGDDMSDSNDAAYVKPTLILIGNLNDLLAGTASKDQDNGETFCAGAGNDVNPVCGG